MTEPDEGLQPPLGLVRSQHLASLAGSCLRGGGGERFLLLGKVLLLRGGGERLLLAKGQVLLVVVTVRRGGSAWRVHTGVLEWHNGVFFRLCLASCLLCLGVKEQYVR